MSEGSQDKPQVSEREPYGPPELTRHGGLDELTQGAGSKDIEKGSGTVMR
jgi:hypothetical protein